MLIRLVVKIRMVMVSMIISNCLAHRMAMLIQMGTRIVLILMQTGMAFLMVLMGQVI